MRKLLNSLIFLIAPIAVWGQGNPPPVGAFTYSAGSWVKAITSSTGSALSYTPPPAALYCFNSSTGKWVPADSTCFGGLGSMTWPSSAGIPNYNGSNAWGTSYSASNLIPISFQQTNPSSTFYVNGASTFAGTPDGTQQKPFLTYGAAAAAGTALNAPYTVWLTSGSYTESSAVSVGTYPHTIYGNDSTLTFTNGLTLNGPADVYDLNTVGNITYAYTGTIRSERHGGSYATGNITISGFVHWYGVQLTNTGGAYSVTVNGTLAGDFITGGMQIKSGGSGAFIALNNVNLQKASGYNFDMTSGGILALNGGYLTTGSGPNIYAPTANSLATSHAVQNLTFVSGTGASFGASTYYVYDNLSIDPVGALGYSYYRVGSTAAHPAQSWYVPTQTQGDNSTKTASTAYVDAGLSGKQVSGTYVTTIGVISANGVSGTSSGGTTPALTISLSDITPSSVSTSGTTPGKVSLVAGTGNIPALPANSAGFAAPASGGTSYLFKLPATATAGILHAATPATADGVSESALTSSQVALADLSATGTPSSSTFLRGDWSWGTVTSGCLLNCVIGSSAVGTVPLTVNGFSSGQTADLQDWYNYSGGTKEMWLTPAGVLTLAGSGSSNISIGTGTPLAGAILNGAQSNAGSTVQINVQNTSSDAAASSDLVATADNGTNTTNYLDCGVNSSTYSVAGFNTGGADDGYCYSTGNFNLAAAGSGKSVTINAGGTTTTQTVATFAPTAITFTQPLTLPAASGITGVTSGVAAGAGYVGQLLSSCIARGSGTALTSASTINFLTLSLTAGDWDLEGNVNLVGSALTATNGNFANSISTTSATINTDGSEVLAPTLTMTTWTGYNSVVLPRKVVNVSATTSTYLVVNFQGTITSGTGTLWGCMTARRVH